MLQNNNYQNMFQPDCHLTEVNDVFNLYNYFILSRISMFNCKIEDFTEIIKL